MIRTPSRGASVGIWMSTNTCWKKNMLTWKRIFAHHIQEMSRLQHYSFNMRDQEQHESCNAILRLQQSASLRVCFNLIGLGTSQDRGLGTSTKIIIMKLKNIDIIIRQRL